MNTNLALQTNEQLNVGFDNGHTVDQKQTVKVEKPAPEKLKMKWRSVGGKLCCNWV